MNVGGVICKFCNLSIPFHGCMLDFGTCRTKPGQYCIKEVLIKGPTGVWVDGSVSSLHEEMKWDTKNPSKEDRPGRGIEWYSVKGCTEDKSECFKRIIKNYEIRTSHCCHRPLCNF
ncbi:uncharacterized protein C9orf57 homolog isoform X2 [Mastomys coucha]|uniref:uncharacterized protein C9orf57 homolog isoform X2 n=1 Tax=Mastomys coucha TaxID=35658 RepID=UPI0012618BBC|nr:uncharacterized protein C9orf57 homolog isoform X2 [Mastomys coucha]